MSLSLPDDPEATNLVSEIISSLQSAFRPVDFERAAKLILSREENLRRLLKEKERRIESLETERLEKTQEVADLRAKVEEYARRIEDLLRNEVELKERNRDLEVEKLKAEKDLEVYRTRFSVLEVQLQKLERGFESVCLVVDRGEFGVVEERGGGVKVKLKPEENGGEECRVDGGGDGSKGEMRIGGEGDIGSGMDMSKAGDKNAGVGLDGRLGNSNCEANGGGSSVKSGWEMRIGGERNVGTGMDMGKTGQKTAEVGLDGGLGNSNCEANGGVSLMRNGGGGELRRGGEGNVDLDGVLGNSNFKANGSGSSTRDGGKMRMDGEGKIGSRTNSSTGSEKIGKAAFDSVNAYENVHLKANGVGCFMGNGVIKVEDCERPLPKTIVEITESDESTPTPRVAAEEVVTRVKRKHPSPSDIGGSNNCNNHDNDETNQGREKLMKVDCCAATTTKNIGGGTFQFASRLDVECVSDDTSSSNSGLDGSAFMPISSLDQTAMSVCKRKWEFETDMISVLWKDGMFCLKAICVLYRCQALMEFDKIDSSRIQTLANFLIGGDPQQKLTKTVKDLQNYDPKGLYDCRRLALKYSRQLFRLYKRNGDSLFWS